MNTKNYSACLLFTTRTVILLILVFSQLGMKYTTASASNEKVPDVQQLFEKCFSEQGVQSYQELTGKINFVGTDLNQPILPSIASLGVETADGAARGYLSECGSLFGLKNQAAELNVKRQYQTGDGRSVVRFQQNYQGIPVFGGELIVQLNPRNEIIMVNGEILPDIQLPTQPVIDSGNATQKALQIVSEKYSAEINTLKVSEPQLWVYSPILLHQQGKASLVWRMEVKPILIAPIRELILIDAISGDVNFEINQVDTAKNRKTYTAENGTGTPGTLVCDESDPTCSVGDIDAANAHIYGGDTYDFYANYHGRDSLDNAGMQLISTVHYDYGYCNAFWDGAQMTYGDNTGVDGCFIVADDVVGHEMTHGITEHESNLIYAYESGAINESFSDIWGEFIDLTNGKGNDTSEVRWEVGEDTSIGAIRDMKNPPVFDNPDRMGSPLYYVGSSDNGGVHTNSGVGNKTAYLITDGDTFNGFTVTGIGITKTAKIYYEAQTNILTSSSDYLDLSNALFQSCVNLIGTSGITSSDCTQVQLATYATEIKPYSAQIPDPIAPSGVGANNLPTYSWTKISQATKYELQLNKGSTRIYTKSIASSACGSTIYCENKPTTVLKDAAYTWRVRAYVNNSWQSLSSALGFSVRTVPVPSLPAGTITDTKPTYTWLPLPGATNYQYQVSKGTKVLFTNNLPASDCSNDTCSVTPNQGLTVGSYTWKVRGQVGGVWKPYSAALAFTVKLLTGFNSQFSGNSTGWTPLNGKWSIGSGYYKSPGILEKDVSSAFGNKYTTFTYNVKMKRTGDANYANFVYFRGSPSPLNAEGNWNNGYRLTYTNSGYYSIILFYEGDAYWVVDWTYSSSINSDWNNLKVSMNGSYTEIYINGSLVAYGTMSDLTTGQVGFGYYSPYLGSGNQLLIDYATLTLSAPADNLNKQGVKINDIGVLKIDNTKNINSAPAQ